MTEIITRPDKRWGLQQINERFEVAWDTPPQLVTAMAYETTKYAVDKYKLRGWHWKHELGVELDESELQLDLHPFGAVNQPDPIKAAVDATLNKTQRGKTAYVVKLWFLVPLDVVTVPTEPGDIDYVAEADGFTRNVPDDNFDKIVKV